MDTKQLKLIDLHEDLIMYIKSGKTLQTSFDMLRNHVSLFFASVFHEPPFIHSPAPEIGEAVMRDIAWYKDMADREKMTLVTNRNALEKNSENTNPGFILHLEGAYALTPETEHFLDEWYDAGLRSVGLLWNSDNTIGTAAASNRSKEGLTPFGKRMVRRMSEKGMIVDCAHINEAGFYDVLDALVTPPIVTHGNARALCDRPRNFTDAQIKALREKDGIIGVFFPAGFIRNDESATIDDAVRHILHIISVGGIETVAIGSDFGGITGSTIPGLNSLDCMPAFAEKLRAAGLSDADIEQIFSGNAKRYITRILSS